MERKEFNEIIDFAIEKEKEAIDFYSFLKEKTEFKFMHDVLEQFKDMEQGHVLRLKNLRNVQLDSISFKPVTPLKLSDYFEEPLSFDDLDYPKLLLIAMKREEKAKNLYLDLANHMTETDMKKVFALLADEEDKHKIQFEKIYDEEILKQN